MTFEGHVEGFALTDFLQAIHIGSLTGFARVTQGDSSATILVRGGRIEYASSSMLGPLGESLVAKQVITEVELSEALITQHERQRHHLLASLLAELGMAPFRELEHETAEHIRTVVGELLGWSHGVFVFQPHEMPHEVSVLQDGIHVEEILLASLFTRETISGLEGQPTESEDELER